ncbi:MAG TPA: anthranilate synthase component I family protein [Phycisphaerae bacterium]|nr:anthranilate synthase component I family protein [Phycisphaerae bacterium]
MSHSIAIPDRTLTAAARPVAWPENVEAVFSSLARQRGCLWLDSAGGPAHLARWSVLAAEPSAVLLYQDGTARVEPGHFEFRVSSSALSRPFDALGEFLAAVRLEGDETFPFGPGLYGYLAYDLAPHIEPKAVLSPIADIPLPDLWFGLYEAVLLLDHLRHEAFLIGAPGPASAAIEEALAAPWCAMPPPAPLARKGRAESACNFSRAAYLEAVARAHDYIAAGDIFQVNLSRRFSVPLDGAASPPARLADLYLRLRRANPAPYAAYVGLGGGRAVLSSSPELFLDLHGGRVVTRPIKGTRPLRPGDDAFNRRMREELLGSEKDRAELVMIVDLERNDLGRVCSYGSVRVAEPRALEPYAAVHHTVASVEGRLHPDRGVVDLLKATFPGGSITGAPKVRAMQIIAELEPTRRSVYTGAVGYLGPRSARDPAGRCALNIAIRTLLADGSRVHLQVGGGIVADSRPEAEFDETTDKARAMLAALAPQSV